MMVPKALVKPMAGLFLILWLMYGASAQFTASVNVSEPPNNTAPVIVSVRTFSSYVDDSVNVPSSHFRYPENATVYVQVKISDAEGYTDVDDDGYVRVKIVFWDGTFETEFPRFGSAYVDAFLESGSGNNATYLYSFTMQRDDPQRLGIESPHLYYRVDAQVSDGLLNASAGANYTYEVYIPVNPPPVLFDISINIPENKRIVDPGDSFYATVSITKVSPPGQDDIRVTYTIKNPNGVTIDYMTEMVWITSTPIYRVPVFYLPRDAIPGYYVVRATVLYQSVEAWTEASFYVRGPPVTTTSTTTATSTTFGPSTTQQSTTTMSSTTISPTTSYTTTSVTRHEGEQNLINIPLIIPEARSEISIYKYPEELYCFDNESKTFMVIVENTGTITLNDVSVYLGGPLSVTSVVPEKIEAVEEGSRKIFLVTVRIPRDQASGEYDMTLKAIAKDASTERYMKLIILPRPNDVNVEMKQKLDDLAELIQSVWNEAVEIGINEQSKDINQVFVSLKEARNSIDKARGSWMAGDFDKTDAALDEAHDYIEGSVIYLANLKSEKKKEIKEIVSTNQITIYAIPPIFWALAVVALTATLLLAYEMSKKSKPTRKLEERYDLRRTKDMILGRAGRLQNIREEA